jgi:hypothetical protein
LHIGGVLVGFLFVLKTGERFGCCGHWLFPFGFNVVGNN